MNSFRKSRIILFLVMFILVPLAGDGLSKRDMLFKHVQHIKVALQDKAFKRVEEALSSTKTDGVIAFNLAFSSFFQLYVNWNLDEAKKGYIRINESYGDRVNLIEYNQIFEETLDRFKKIEPTKYNQNIALQTFNRYT